MFGVVSLDERPTFMYQFSDVFNGQTFWSFLEMVVRRSRGRKVYMIIDNAPCHQLPPEGRKWLKENRTRIELFRLPPYSPEFNPIEGIWKTTKRMTTHNRFYRTVEERDESLVATFESFRRKPRMLAGHVRRFL